MAKRAAGSIADARSLLDAAALFTQRIELLRAEAQAAPEAVAQLESQLADPPPPQPIPDELADATAPEWEAALATAEAELAAAGVRLAELSDRIELEGKRRLALPAELEAARSRLAAVEVRVNAAPVEATDLTTEIGQAHLLAERTKLLAEAELLQQEARTYEATSRRLTLERDAVAQRQLRLREFASRLRTRLVEIRESDAARRVRRIAQQAAAAEQGASQAVAGEWTQTLAFARQNQDVVEELDDASVRLVEANRTIDELVRDFASLRTRAEEADFSTAAGSLMREYRRRLAPARRQVDRFAAVEIGGASMPIDDAIAAVQSQLDQANAAQQRLLLRTGESEAMQQALRERRLTLVELMDNANKLLVKLVALATARESLRGLIAEQTGFISEHILWVRSAPPIGPETARAAAASAPELLDRTQWAEAGSRLLADVRTNPIWIVLAAILLVASFVVRARLRAVLKACCDAARKPTLVSVAPTWKALAASLLLALFLPGVAWLLGWRLEATARPGSLPAAFGGALRQMALLGFLIEFIRIVARPHGLGASHFGWPADAVASVRRVLWVIIVVALPAGVIELTVRRLGNETLINSIGRIAFLVSATAFAWAGWSLFRRQSPVMAAARARQEESLIARIRWIWAIAAIGMPIALALMAIEGHYYTAQQLAHRALLTASGLALLVLVKSTFNRVVLINYRRLAIKRAKEKRAERRAQQEALGEEEGEPSDVIEAETDEPEVPLVEVSNQTNTLIRIATVVTMLALVYGSWIDVLPAVGWIGDRPLYDDQLAIAAGLPDNATVDDRSVTLADLLQAITLAGLTILAARNLPGLLEIAVLPRLPLDAGARYAASAIARYAIAIVGVIVCFRLIGIGWESVQWLVAAVSVGLGFGLQEIFANFVSGLILLFERPIRVGDTVTINDITGTVTRIRIRATTVLDWDNRELVMPNKDFVTGNLINWTLSNPNVRVVQSVGIAYGSNTELATELLKGAAESNSRILDEPQPLVVFTEFGDNSLVFELRFFVSGLQAYRTIKHDLNMQIDRMFREADIEISFPQRDLHLRSIDQNVRDAILPRDVFAAP